MPDDIQRDANTVLKGAEGVRELNPDVLILPAQGNSLAIRTDRGIVMMDSGPGRGTTDRMIAALREWSNDPVRAICYSHGHMGYNDGMAKWLQHAADRGDPAPDLIAQENVPKRYARYRETEGLQQQLNQMQFPQFKIRDPAKGLTDPTVTFRETHVLEGTPRIELYAAPSETDDAMVLWVPDMELLYAGPAFPGSTIANIGTPLRTVRLTVRWAETLERMAALGPRIMVQEFGHVIEGRDAVSRRLLGTAEALRWMRREVVERMGRGMTDVEIIHDLDYPEELFEQPWMREQYGAREYIVRDLWREENGWWDRNPTSLHPAHPAAAADAILSALPDPGAVLARARELEEAGDIQLALHVIDLLALASAETPEVREAKEMKARLCLSRADQIEPYVSKALYKSSAMKIDESLKNG